MKDGFDHLTESTQAALILSEHTKGYNSSSEEVWGYNAVCSMCDHAWPCDTARLGLLLTDEITVLKRIIVEMQECWPLEPNHFGRGRDAELFRSVVSNG
jgi:hypothetical protein